MNRSKMMVAAGALLLAAGCSRSPEQDQAKAAEAQRTADDKTNKARSEAVDKVTEAQNQADDTANKAKVEADKASAQAQANANDTIRDANRDIVKARNDVRESSQKKVDDIDNLIDHARAKAQTASPQARVQFNEVMKDVTPLRDTVRNDIAAIDTKTADQISATKERISKDIADLRASVSRLQSTI